MTYTPGHTLDRKDAYDKWQNVIDQIGETFLLDNIFDMLDTDTVTWILEMIDNDYELNLFEENED